MWYTPVCDDNPRTKKAGVQPAALRGGRAAAAVFSGRGLVGSAECPDEIIIIADPDPFGNFG